MQSGTSRGAAAVEFALIAPLLVLLVFACIEVPLSMYSTGRVTEAAADGARIASIARNAPDADQRIVDAVLDGLESSPGVSVSKVIVYRTTRLGGGPPAACVVASRSSRCAVYIPPFTAGCDGGWCPARRVAGDIVGVAVFARHERLSGVVPTPTSSWATATAVIEPDVL